MTKSPSISEAEWEVMNILWCSKDPLTAADVVERLASKRAWSPRTVKTLLNRLIKKNALQFDAHGKSYLYRPAIKRDQCVREAARSFVSRVFSGSTAPMLMHFVTHTELTAAEVAELQKLLRQKQAGIVQRSEQRPTRKR